MVSGGGGGPAIAATLSLHTNLGDYKSRKKFHIMEFHLLELDNLKYGSHSLIQKNCKNI